METKSLHLRDCGLKLAGEVPGFFEGYIAHFGSKDSYDDVIEPGAFKQTLEDRQRPVLMRFNHRSPLIGRWKELREDSTGLYGIGELTPGHSVAADVYASMKHETLGGLSFAYSVPSMGEETKGGVRYLKRIALHEAGPVEEPANLNAIIIGVKQVCPDWKSLADAEAWLSDSYGLSSAEACALVSRIKAIAGGDRQAKSAAAEIAGLFDLHRISDAFRVR